MERMSGLDAGFLYMETPTQHLHTMKVALVDPSRSPGGYSFERVAEVLGHHLHLLPAFRQRVVPIPGQPSHPVMVEDSRFNLADHLHTVRADPPGGQAELDAVVSRIAGGPLDRSRPLWELWVVEGLEDGYIGFVAKIHHCLADGVKAAEMLLSVLGPDPGAGTPEPGGARPVEEVPGSWILLRGAGRDLLRDLWGLPGLLRRTVRGARALRAARRSGRTLPPPPFSTIS